MGERYTESLYYLCNFLWIYINFKIGSLKKGSRGQETIQGEENLNHTYTQLRFSEISEDKSTYKEWDAIKKEESWTIKTGLSKSESN